MESVVASQLRMSEMEIIVRGTATILSAFVCMLRMKYTAGQSGIGWYVICIAAIWRT